MQGTLAINGCAEVCAKNNDTAYYMALAPRLNDVEFCNLMLTLINQTIVMLKLLIEKV